LRAVWPTNRNCRGGERRGLTQGCHVGVSDIKELSGKVETLSGLEERAFAVERKGALMAAFAGPRNLGRMGFAALWLRTSRLRSSIGSSRT
jgi:hypothetical protein